MPITVKQLDVFSEWLKSLKDSLTRQRLVKQQAVIRRALALARTLED